MPEQEDRSQQQQQQDERAGKAANTDISPEPNFATSQPAGGTAPPNTRPPSAPQPTGGSESPSEDGA